MAYNLTHARALCSADELALFDDSRAEPIRRLDAGQLRRRIERTRALRDKYRDLYQRQRRQTRSRTGSKGGVSGRANERTQKKATLFDQVLERFQARLQELERSAVRTPTARRMTAASEPMPEAQAPKTQLPAGFTAEPRSSKARRGFVDDRAAVRAQQRHLHEINQPAIHGHLSSRDRRNQAKRDQR